MIHIVISSYKEPKSTLRAAKIFLKQKIPEDFKVIAVDPFPEVEKFLLENIKDDRFEFFLDPGEGKVHGLNMLLEVIYSENNDDIIIMTDGDVYVSENSLQEIVNAFKDKKIGCVTGRPVSLNPRNTKYGFWAQVLYGGIDKVRKRLSNEGEFLQCSGYLFAIRNGIIKEIPIDVPEDCVIPYLVWRDGFRVAYIPNAEVYIQYPSNWKDWLSQRVRTIKAHENLDKIIPDMPRTKSLFNEIKEGLLYTLKQPKNLKELAWLFNLYYARLYIYYKSFSEARKRKEYDPGWRDYSEIESAKPLD
jgi:cellulose synthase/poly-beta-1,6-N-acetylglucosamine synthase-like glycosyltransferase